MLSEVVSSPTEAIVESSRPKADQRRKLLFAACRLPNSLNVFNDNSRLMFRLQTIEAIYSLSDIFFASGLFIG